MHLLVDQQRRFCFDRFELVTGSYQDAVVVLASAAFHYRDQTVVAFGSADIRWDHIRPCFRFDHAELG